MAHIVTDKVMETTTTTGTGAISLGGAVSGYQDFDSQMANADTTVYAIKGISGASIGQWEVGLGTWNTGNTLSRTTVVRSSNANAAVNLSAGTKLIYMTFTPTVRQPGMSFTGALTPATNDLAALGSSSLSWADLFLASGGLIDWANGQVQLNQNGADQLTLIGGGLRLNFSSTTVAPIYIEATTLTTTTSAGFLERDATNFYGTTDDDNRGIIPVTNFIRLDGSRTFTSNTNSQAIFTSPTNGRITLETGTYRFKAVLQFGAMSATSGNRSINILGAGTATLGTIMWIAVGLDGTGATPAAGSVAYYNTAGSAASVVSAAVGTSLGVLCEGSFEVTGAGTMIPSTAMVTAAASTLTPGSFWEIWRTGSTSVVSVGQWD